MVRGGGGWRKEREGNINDRRREAQDEGNGGDRRRKMQELRTEINSCKVSKKEKKWESCEGMYVVPS